MVVLNPLKITKSHLKPLKRLYFNIEGPYFFSKASLAVFQNHFHYTFQKSSTYIEFLIDVASFLEISRISW